MLPFKYYGDLLPFMDAIFNEASKRDITRVKKEFPIEVITGPTYFKVRAIIAGIPSSKITLNVDNNILTISADIKDENQLSEEESVYINEIQYGHYSRQIEFKQPINGDEVKATLSNGVLELFLPKMKSQKGKNIIIKDEGS